MACTRPFPLPNVYTMYHVWKEKYTGWFVMTRSPFYNYPFIFITEIAPTTNILTPEKCGHPCKLQTLIEISHPLIPDDWVRESQIDSAKPANFLRS